MRLRRLDLNLLLALEALLSLRSVTAAASRLHVSQPSMSGSLARLREHFGDSLLVPVGRKLELTALGEMLLDPVREALEKVEATIALRPDFDPATGKRHFLVCASEATVLTLLIEVIRHAEQQAPGVTVELLPADPGQMADKLNRRELDFAFMVEHAVLREHPAALVLNDTFHCVVWQGNRRVKKSLSLEQYLSLGHAVTRYGFDRRPGFEQYTLDRLGVQRRVEVSCTTPALLGPLVVGTQRIATMPTRLANQQVAYLPLKLFQPPLDLPPLRIAMQWHRSREHDGATAWMRDLIVATSSEMGYSARTDAA
jgi:LysR family nod box-dependent transcriptional activator